jgi:hemerythrin-like domain-containing protein
MPPIRRTTAEKQPTPASWPRARKPEIGDPLEAMKASHRQIRVQCDLVRRLAERVSVHGSDAEAQHAASTVLRFFDGAGRHHEEDEELDVFPRMIAAGARGAERIALLTAQLTQEHRHIEACWADLRESLETIAHGEETALSLVLVERFCGAYLAHLALEDANLIPLAAMVLDSRALGEIVRGMARRRGLR